MGVLAGTVSFNCTDLQNTGCAHKQLNLSASLDVN